LGTGIAVARGVAVARAARKARTMMDFMVNDEDRGGKDMCRM
jgi:hypothetical protein